MKRIKEEIRVVRIIDTKHSIDRFNDENRFKFNAGTEEFRKRIRKVIIDGAKQIIRQHNDRQGVYLIHSKSTYIGVVVEWRKDWDDPTGPNQAIVVSFLPMKSEPYAKHPSDTILKVEAYHQLKAMAPKRLFESDETGAMDRHYITENCYLIFFEGKLWDISCPIIEIE